MVALCLPLSLKANPGSYSLLFSPYEVSLIREHREGGGDLTSVVAPLAKLGALYLGSILYVDSDHWTVWLNDRVIHAGDSLQFENFHLHNILPDGVSLSWRPEGSLKPVNVELNPHQTYLCEKDAVVSGDARQGAGD